MLVDDSYELLIALIEHLRCDTCHIWLIKQEPVSVLALKDGEIWVEEGSEALEILLPCHLLLDVVRGVHEVIKDLLFYQLGGVLFHFSDDLLDFVFSWEAAP